MTPKQTPPTTPLECPPEKEHVVVLGGGFGGLEFCKRCDRDRYHITLIDRQNHHLFQPLLYQVASAGISAPDIAQPLRSILRRHRNLGVLMEAATEIDLEGGTVSTVNRTIPFDHLVIALGVQTSYFGNDHWADHTVGLKSLEDALKIRAGILGGFERAEASRDENDVRRAMTTVVVGGGPTGVELAGAFAELFKRVMRNDFRRINPGEARIVLVEMADQLLPAYPRDLAEYTRRRLEQMGVEVMTESPVTEVGPEYVVTGGETIEASHIIWAAGMQAPGLTRDLGVPTDKAGRIKVEPDLSLPGHPNVFAIGDIVHLVDANDRPVPGVSPAAIQMGKHVARILLRGEREPFAYFDKGSMATIGRHSAVAETGKVKFTGVVAWLMWLLVHLLFLVGFRNKVVVFWHWFYSYLTYRNGARIIIGDETR